MMTTTYARRTCFAATLGLFSFVTAALAPTAAAQSAAGKANVNAALQGSVDSRHAQVGQQVSATTTAKAMAGETTLPKGTQLMGHVTSVSQHAKDGADGSVGMVFDRAQLKDGTTVPIHSSLKSIAPAANHAAAADAQTSPQTDASIGPANAIAGGRTSARASGGGLLGGTLGAVGGATRGVANAGGAVVGGVAHTTTGLVAGVSSIPGVVLSTGVEASTSGVVSAAGRDVTLDSGTQLVLDVAVQ